MRDFGTGSVPAGDPVDRVGELPTAEDALFPASPAGFIARPFRPLPLLCGTRHKPRPRNPRTRRTVDWYAHKPELQL